MICLLVFFTLIRIPSFQFGYQGFESQSKTDNFYKDINQANFRVTLLLLIFLGIKIWLIQQQERRRSWVPRRDVVLFFSSVNYKAGRFVIYKAIKISFFKQASWVISIGKPPHPLQWCIFCHLIYAWVNYQTDFQSFMSSYDHCVKKIRVFLWEEKDSINHAHYVNFFQDFWRYLIYTF